MVGHQLIAEDTTGVPLQPFGKNALEGVVVSVLLENIISGIATVQRVVDAIGFVGSFWSGHPSSVPYPKSQNNDS